ncbi:hypothetical protein HDU91_007241 [Kappamyces sp. JEL0680]|nr:hypothetical protein HDU91_007241 [Kappamyces sp. JEL0680]
MTLPNDLDKAILRRMPKRFSIALPSMDQRLRVLELLLSKIILAPDCDLGKIAMLTEGYSNSDLKELCRNSVMVPVREALKELSQKEKPEGGVIPKVDPMSLKLRSVCMRDFTGFIDNLYERTTSGRVPVARKGLFNVHVNDVANYFRGFHLHIQARHEEDVQPALIMQKVKDSSGAKYSIQANVANPSIAKPAPKPYVPPPAASNMYRPPPAVVSAPPASESPKPLYAPATSSYQPIKTEPKPLGATSQAPFGKAVEEAPKPLYASASSSYQAIKTNPKPLATPPAFSQAAVPAASSDKPAFPSLASRAQAFNQPAPAASSSYEPIKLAPKPLYGEGVATKTYVAPEQTAVASTTLRSSVSGRESTSGYIPPTRPSVTSSGTDAVQRRVEEQRRQEERLAQQRRDEQVSQPAEQTDSSVQERMQQMRIREEKERQAQQEAVHNQQMQQRANQERLEREAREAREAAAAAQQEQERQMALEAAKAPVHHDNALSAIVLYDYTPGRHSSS